MSAILGDWNFIEQVYLNFGISLYSVHESHVCKYFNKSRFFN